MNFLDRSLAHSVACSTLRVYFYMLTLIDSLFGKLMMIYGLYSSMDPLSGIYHQFQKLCLFTDLLHAHMLAFCAALRYATLRYATLLLSFKIMCVPWKTSLMKVLCTIARLLGWSNLIVFTDHGRNAKISVSFRQCLLPWVLFCSPNTIRSAFAVGKKNHTQPPLLSLGIFFSMA